MPNEIVSEIDGHVGIIWLNRPEVPNALSPALTQKLVTQLDAYDDVPNSYAIRPRGRQ